MDVQKQICQRFSSSFVACQPSDKLGLAVGTLGGTPINGLRNIPQHGTCGWYIWCGEAISEEPDFFSPLHCEHIEGKLSGVLPYLGLEPGFRFLIAGNYVDVWKDEKLLKI